MDKLKKMDSKGFTLVELIIVILITGIVMTAVYQLFTSSRQYTASIANVNEYQRLATEIIYEIRSDIADASSVEVISVVNDDGTSAIDTGTEEYGYIIANPIVKNADGSFSGGGATFDAIYIDRDSNPASPTVERSAERTVGQVSKDKKYKVKVTFTTNDSNYASVSVSIVIPEGDTVTDPNTGASIKTDMEVYTENATIQLRSANDSSVTSTDGIALRYRMTT
jgi:prepilin-type N-terminal cleavage/methylation domain-containing protein